METRNVVADLNERDARVLKAVLAAKLEQPVVWSWLLMAGMTLTALGCLFLWIVGQALPFATLVVIFLIWSHGYNLHFQTRLMRLIQFQSRSGNA